MPSAPPSGMASVETSPSASPPTVMRGTVACSSTGCQPSRPARPLSSVMLAVPVSRMNGTRRPPISTSTVMRRPAKCAGSRSVPAEGASGANVRRACGGAIAAARSSAVGSIASTVTSSSSARSPPATCQWRARSVPATGSKRSNVVTTVRAPSRVISRTISPLARSTKNQCGLSRAGRSAITQAGDVPRVSPASVQSAADQANALWGSRSTASPCRSLSVAWAIALASARQRTPCRRPAA